MSSIYIFFTLLNSRLQNVKHTNELRLKQVRLPVQQAEITLLRIWKIHPLLIIFSGFHIKTFFSFFFYSLEFARRNVVNFLTRPKMAEKKTAFIKGFNMDFNYVLMGFFLYQKQMKNFRIWLKLYFKSQANSKLQRSTYLRITKYLHNQFSFSFNYKKLDFQISHK